MAPKIAPMKSVPKAKGVKKDLKKGVTKSATAHDQDDAKNGNTKLTKLAVEQHTRAHEVACAKKFGTVEEAMTYLDKLPPKDKEQIWKQSLVCTILGGWEANINIVYVFICLYTVTFVLAHCGWIAMYVWMSC